MVPKLFHVKQLCCSVYTFFDFVYVNGEIR